MKLLVLLVQFVMTSMLGDPYSPTQQDDVHQILKDMAFEEKECKFIQKPLETHNNENGETEEESKIFGA
jgi:hypothetical protein